MRLENNPELVDLLRKRRQAGEDAAALLRMLDEHGLSQVEMMSHFREAFDLEFHDVSCIGGWFADQTGELTDDQINALLKKSIDKRT